MSTSASLASITLAAILFSTTASLAKATPAATDEAVQHAPAASLLAQNPAAQCVNGYRVTHRVRGHDRLTQGVILKCRS